MHLCLFARLLNEFQQNYGLFTVFGGVANFAHNIVLQEDSNLTFGLNVGAYQSGLDKGKIITDDTAILNGDYPSRNYISLNIIWMKQTPLAMGGLMF